MDPHQITKPFLVVVCYVLFFFLLLVVASIPGMTFASLDSSSSQPEPGPQMQLPPPQPQPEPESQPQPEPGPQMQLPPPQPQPDFQPFNEEPLISRPRHLVLNLTEQITFQESTENTPSPFELTISSDQRSANIVVGDTAQATLTVGLASGNTQPVSLSCNLSPPSSQASCNISPSTVTPVGTATLAITTQDTISPGQYTATITATPEQGINQTTNFVVVVDAKPDTNPPVISVPSSPIQVNASGPSGAQVQYQASATDDVDGPINVTCIPPSGSTFPIGETIVECSATDAAGNTGTASFTITIQDTTPPAISVPDDITAEATSPNGVQVPFEVSAEDDVGGAIEVRCDHNSGETFPIGETVVTCNTVDAAGNTATSSFTVTVNPAPDTTPPVITVPEEDITVEATSEEGAVVTYTVSAQDDRDGTLPVECTPASDSTFAIDTTNVNCEATDAAGNTATASFTVTVNPAPDTKPPVITVPEEDIRVEATIGAEGAEVPFEVSAEDDGGDTVEVRCDHNSGETFPIGETVVTCKATDSSSNAAEESFSITVVAPVADIDTVPVITVSTTTPIEVEATSNSGEEVIYNVTALDREDGSLIPHCDPPSGSIFRVGETPVRCNVIDTAGNSVSEDFLVIVRGTQDGSSLIFIIIAIIIAAIVVAVVIILLIRRGSSTEVDKGTQVY